MGESVQAVEFYESALPTLRTSGDERFVSMLLNNRGLIALAAGDLAMARDDLEAARTIDESRGSTYNVATIDHSLARIHALEGDLPAALKGFGDSEAQIRAMIGSAAEIQVSHVETLLSAGLFREASSLSQQIVEEMGRSGHAEEVGEAMLVGAEALLLSGDAGASTSMAQLAAEEFESQNRRIWADRAAAVELAASFESGVATPARHLMARETANRLLAGQQFNSALNCFQTAGLIAESLGDAAAAIEDFEVVANSGSGTFEVDFQVWFAKAMIRKLSGNFRGAVSAARAGLRLQDSFQATLGASDIRSAIEARSRHLGELGLSLALSRRRPRPIFEWMERTRARSLRVRPVVPPADSQQGAELTELRTVGISLRSATGAEASRLMRRERRLQTSIRDRSRVTRGSESPRQSVGLAASTARALGGRSLVEFATLGDRLVAVFAKRGRFRFLEIGNLNFVKREIESLRFAFRRTARRRSGADQIQSIARRLDDALFGTVGALRGEVVIVATPDLYAVPWSSLPSLAGASTVISPSAELWVDRSAIRLKATDIVVIAGPDLVLAEKEALAISDIYQSSHLLRSDRATVDATADLINGASIAHIACHAFFEYQNPMFSSLRLFDGDLNVYDIERLERPPELVILSACDSGFSDGHPGQELLGLSSALIAMGTRTVIASVGLVPDSVATRSLMVEFHKGLLAGIGPAESLHRAQVSAWDTPEGLVAASSFICIGAG
jgi:tetratricopeptide (TPR) repeat protein